LIVSGDVVALRAVTARDALHELALLVAHAHRDAVDLWLDDEAELLALERLLHAVDEGLELAGRVGVVEALHRDRVLHRREVRQRLAADALARRIADVELGMRCFEVDELAVKPVVILVRDERLRFLVVGAVQLADFLHQLAMLFGSGHISKCSGGL
jgi:hypothetical protein